MISHNQIKMDPAKVQEILEWPDPLTIKQVQGLLGFGNFYRRFIKGYSKLVRPLTSLLWKGRVFKWGEEQKETLSLEDRCDGGCALTMKSSINQGGWEGNQTSYQGDLITNWAPWITRDGRFSS